MRKACPACVCVISGVEPAEYESAPLALPVRRPRVIGPLVRCPPPPTLHSSASVSRAPRPYAMYGGQAGFVVPAGGVAEVQKMLKTASG